MRRFEPGLLRRRFLCGGGWELGMMEVGWIAVEVALAGESEIASDSAGAVFGRGDCVLVDAGLGGQVVKVGLVGHLIEVPVKK